MLNQLTDDPMNRLTDESMDHIIILKQIFELVMII